MSNSFRASENNFSDKATIFRLNLEKISFMYAGMFLLKLTINNSILSDKSGVRLRTKNSDKFIKDFSVRTEVIEPSKKESFSSFVMDEYNFYLPKGFCKNDMDHDVYLLIEAFQILPDAKTQIIGSAKLPIYPRSDVKSNFNVSRGEPFYSFKGSIRLLRPNIKDFTLHCGDLFYKSEFCEILEIIEPDHVPLPKPVPVALKPSPEPPKEKAKTPTPPPPTKSPLPSTPLPKRMIEVGSTSEEPLKPNAGKPIKDKMIHFGMPPPIVDDEVTEFLPEPAKTQISKTFYRLLSPVKKEEISVFVRAAENIMNSNQAAIPSYVACALKTDDTVSDSTHVSNNSTFTPFWEEILNLAFPPEKIERLLSIKVIDNSAREVITEFLLPIKTLEPFFQHHLKLCQSFNRGNANPILYVTIIRKLDHYPLTGKEQLFSAFIVKPLTLYNQLYSIQKHPVSCFMYLSNDATQKISKNIQSIDANFVEVFNPVPSNYSYHTNSKYPMWSSGQLSIPSIIDGRYDALNFPFLFCQKPEMDTIFTVNSFIVFDFYCVPSSVGINWRNNPPVGQSILKLDKLLYRQLQSPEKYWISTNDFKINWENVPLWMVLSSDNPTKNTDKEDKLRIKIALTNENLCEEITTESDSSFTPIKMPDNVELSTIKDVPKSITREPFLYEIRSLRSPQSRDYLFNESDYPSSKQFTQEITSTNRPIQNKELSYKNNLKKLQIELTNLRRQYRSLQTENQSLEEQVLSRRKTLINEHNDHLQEIKDLPVPELYQRYDKLRRGLGSQMSMLADFRDKEKKLRSTLAADLSKKDDHDIYKRLRVSNEKLQNLEKVAKEKEQIISKLEAILDKKDRWPDKVHGNDSTSASFAGVATAAGDEERNQLYDLIERSENRIIKLQTELIDLSRKRGARKQMRLIQEREKLFQYNDL